MHSVRPHLHTFVLIGVLLSACAPAPASPPLTSTPSPVPATSTSTPTPTLTADSHAEFTLPGGYALTSAIGQDNGKQREPTD